MKSAGSNKRFIIAAAFILLIIGLFLIDRDIFHYTSDTRLEREFLPEADVKRGYTLLGPLTLKPGAYTLELEMEMEGSGSGIYLLDGEENVFFASDLPAGGKDPVFPFEIKDKTRQVRFGVSYVPETSSLKLSRVRITSPHVLYRESLLRHAVLSLLLILVCAWAVLRLCYPQTLWKLFPAFSSPENETALLVLLVLTVLSSLPLLDPRTYIRGEDMFFHLTRIRGLADSLQAGYFPVRDQLYWLHNYGYGVGFYYPDTFLYLPAILLLLGFELLTAYKLFLILCTFLSIASVWFAALRISRNRTAAIAAAVFMAAAAYRLSNVYYRGALGETQATIFYPLITLGLYEIFHENRTRVLYFALGFFGLFSSHMISLSIGVFLTALFLITQLPKMLREPRIFAVLLRAVFWVAAAGAFFWLPMLEQTFTNPGLQINSILSGEVGLNVTNYAFPLKNIFAPFKTWNYVWQADCIYPGWSLLAVPLLALLVRRKRTENVKTADFLFLFALPVVWMCTRSFPWQWKIFFPFVTRIQFAYRMLLPASVLLSLSGGIYFTQLISEKRKTAGLIILTLFAFLSTAAPVLHESFLNRSVDKRLFVMQDNRVSGAEYLPAGLAPDYPGKNADTVNLTGSDVPLTISAHKRRRLGFSFRFDLPEDSGTVRFSLPLIYYTGYRGTLTTDDGLTLVPEISPDPQGLVSLTNQDRAHGTVTVHYEKTLLQRAGEVITLAAIGSLAFISHRKRRDKIHSRRV